MPDFFLPLLAIIFSMLIVTILSGILANYSVRIAKHFKVANTIIIILLLGFIGSLGELMLAISAIIINYQEFIVGLAIGVSIAMTLLVGGISAIYNKGIPTSSLSHNKLLIALNFSVLLFILLISDNNLSQIDGVILVFVYLYYISQVAMSKESFNLNQFKQITGRKQLMIGLGIILFVLVNLFFSAGYAMQQIYNFEKLTHISILLIAIALASPFGILPELMFELELSKRGTSTIALSDLITSSITNLSLIVGLTAIINPITLSETSLFSFNLFALALVVLVFDIYAYTNKRIDKKEAIVMIIMYFLYLLANFLLVI
jgi:cation:H+ antiporter